MSSATLRDQRLLSWQAKETPAGERPNGFAQNARRSVSDAAAGVVDFFSVSQTNTAAYLPLSSLCTGQVHPSERVRAWVEAFARAAGLPLGEQSTACHGKRICFEQLDARFEGRIDSVAIAGWRLSKVKAGAHALTVNAASESGLPRQLLVVLQLKGVSTFTHEGKELRVGSGEIAIIPVRKSLRIVSEQSVEQYLLWCAEPAQSNCWRGPGLLEERHLGGKSVMHRMLRTFVEMLLAEPIPCDPSRQEFLVQTLDGLLQQSLNERDAEVLRLPSPEAGPSRELILRYIEDNLHDPGLSPDSIALALVCSKRTLHRAFAGSGSGSGESLNRTIWRRRVERCAAELRSATATGRRQTVTQVAFSLGFSSCAHFSRLFKQHVGVTPVRYREGSTALSVP